MINHDLIEADLRWLSRPSELAERESPELRSFHPQEIVRRFAQSLRRELARTNPPATPLPKLRLNRLRRFNPSSSLVSIGSGAASGYAYRNSSTEFQGASSRPRPQGACPTRGASGIEDDCGRRFLPRRPTSRQRILPARQPYRLHRLRHGWAALLGLPLLGLLGFLGAVAGSVWLLLSIWKSSRADRE